MLTQKHPLVVGVIGGIGSGKSAVSRAVSDRLHLELINADQVGHEVLTFPHVKDRIRAAFGNEVFDGNEIDRKRVASRVFGSEPHHLKSLNQLEAIVHPEIRLRLSDLILNTSRDLQAVLLDAPVLLEAGWTELCDAIVFIDAPFEQRLQRVEDNRNWAEEELRRREGTQLSVKEKQSRADFIVNNSGSLNSAVEEFVTWLSVQIPDD